MLRSNKVKQRVCMLVCQIHSVNCEVSSKKVGILVCRASANHTSWSWQPSRTSRQLQEFRDSISCPEVHTHNTRTSSTTLTFLWFSLLLPFNLLASSDRLCPFELAFPSQCRSQRMRPRIILHNKHGRLVANSLYWVSSGRLRDTERPLLVLNANVIAVDECWHRRMLSYLWLLARRLPKALLTRYSRIRL